MEVTDYSFSNEYVVLVTGCAGFIGSNLCTALLENGNRVIGLDNLSTGKRHNLSLIINNPLFDFIEGDIRDEMVCRIACKGVDYVLHQAALGSVPRSIKDPVTTNEVNISGFLNMLVAARDASVKRFIYAASSSTYGDSKIMPKVEEVIGKPLSPYAVTKYVNELYAGIFNETFGLETIGLRYFNVFGRNQDPAGAYAAVIPKFVLQLLRHRAPTINGDGSFSRDFTYIDNVVEANIRAMATAKPEAVNTVYNIAYGERTDLNELVELLTVYLSEFDPAIKDVVPHYGPARPGDVPHSLASIDKARKLLGYNPEYDIKKGLKEAIGWYRTNLGSWE